jgi:membrane associated rhomboid family serine protease
VTSTGTTASEVPPVRPTMTAVVVAITVVVSVAALINTSMMKALTTDVSKLRAGQWWRIASPVVVQPSGWGQLVFNMTGLAVVGAALERHVSRPLWIVCFFAGGVGSVAVLSAWKPADGSGGTSDAVAALIGALAVVAAVESAKSGAEWPSQLYSVFFAAYLTGLAVGGIVTSIIAGDVAVVIYVAARRACRPATVRRGCLVLIVACGAVMTVMRQGHGLGIMFGVAIASAVLARKRTRE